MNNGARSFSPVKENIMAREPDLENKRWMRYKKQMCLRCQTDKPLKGGQLTFIGTFRKFICMDCKLAKQQKDSL